MVSDKETNEKTMVVAAPAGLRNYELVYIMASQAAEKSTNAITERVNQFITEKGGVITGVEQWGKKKLAYPIAQNLEGNYVLTRFQLKPSAVKEIEAQLRITEEVIRHLLVEAQS